MSPPRDHPVLTPSAWFWLAVDRWRIPKGPAWDWWQEIARSAFSEVHDLREAVEGFAGSAGEVDGALLPAVPPAKVMKVLDLLVLERRMSKELARRIGDTILLAVDKYGQWK
jgi:hypothetical protein